MRKQRIGFLISRALIIGIRYRELRAVVFHPLQQMLVQRLRFSRLLASQIVLLGNIVLQVVQFDFVVFIVMNQFPIPFSHGAVGVDDVVRSPIMG